MSVSGGPVRNSGVAFHYDGGIRLTRAGVAIDFRRRQPCGFISHAHADHLASHAYALCTPETAALYRLRRGNHPVREMEYGRPIEWNGTRLTVFPAGHCLGSAMLLAEENGSRLLYTGDFKLRPSLTVRQAEPPQADILITECTYGAPEYRFPPREKAAAMLLEQVETARTRGKIPVVVAYSLGKAQEATRILTDAGQPVVQHPAVYEISAIYGRFGVALGEYRRLEGTAVAPEEVVVLPPQAKMPNFGYPAFRILLTGWAVHPGAAYRLPADAAVPLSDHADYDELFALIDRVRPEIVYCTHGPRSFVDRLLDAGIQAKHIDGPTQGRLF
ncbi:ligase-associated DNA damage response exonuclease [Thermostilla marina]